MHSLALWERMNPWDWEEVFFSFSKQLGRLGWGWNGMGDAQFCYMDRSRVINLWGRCLCGLLPDDGLFCFVVLLFPTLVMFLCLNENEHKV